MTKRIRWGLGLLFLAGLPVGSTASPQGTGGAKLTHSSDPGLLRLGLGQFQKLKLSPLDTYEGYNWGIRGSVFITGSPQVPSSWKMVRRVHSPRIQFVYRRGKSWHPLTWPKGVPAWSIGVGENYPITVNLKTVPRDADEVRMRGEFEITEYFQGTTPENWIPPKNLRGGGNRHSLTLKTKPFDVLVGTRLSLSPMISY